MRAFTTPGEPLKKLYEKPEQRATKSEDVSMNNIALLLELLVKSNCSCSAKMVYIGSGFRS